jgi:hypothetical protein
LQDHIFDAERVGFDELFGAYVGANRGICDAYANGYKPKSDEYVSKTGYRYPAGRKKWREGMSAEFGDANFPYALTEREFTHHPTIVRRFQSKLTCEGCGAWVPGMGPGTFQKFGYPESVAPLRSSMHEQLDDPAAYRDPKNTLGREAARAYWIPFWALVFSMAGALTHLYKVLFLSGTFATHRIGWAMRKVAESRRAFVIHVMEIRLADLFTKACLIFVVSLAIWVGFTENRITAMPEVNASREQLKSDHWLVGRMVFWAVNAQHHAYPINEWLRPGWLTFGTKEVPEEASASTGYAWSCSDYNSYVQPVKAKESDFNVLRMVWDAAAPGAVFRNIAHGWVHMIKRMVGGV